MLSFSELSSVNEYTVNFFQGKMPQIESQNVRNFFVTKK